MIAHEHPRMDWHIVLFTSLREPIGVSRKISIAREARMPIVAAQIDVKRDAGPTKSWMSRHKQNWGEAFVLD